MKLKCLLVVDPVASVAERLAAQCERLAETRLTATTGEKALEFLRSEHPDIVVLSLETKRPDAQEVTRELRRTHPETFVVATFRELSVPTMERLGKLAIEDYLPQPVNLAALFRAASRHFGVHFRRHDRHNVTLEVTRLDGVLIGRTRDLSEGGMLLDAIHPVTKDDSVLINIALPDGPLKVRAHVVGVEGQQPKPVAAHVEFENLRGRDHHRLLDYLTKLSVPISAGA